MTIVNIFLHLVFWYVRFILFHFFFNFFESRNLRIRFVFLSKILIGAKMSIHILKLDTKRKIINHL